MMLETYQLEKLYEYQEVKMFTLIQWTTMDYIVTLEKEVK